MRIRLTSALAGVSVHVNSLSAHVSFQTTRSCGAIAMQLFIRQATLSIAMSFLLVGGITGQIVDDSDQRAADSKQKRSPMVATWHSLSFVMSLEDGSRRTVTDEDGAVSAVITEKTLTLRLGTNVISDMTYVADPKQQPGTIDLKSSDGEMLGIYTVTKDRLQIALNDKTKGRPKDFDEQQNSLVVLFRRVYPVALYTIDADGKNLRRVLLMRDFTFVGSAEWSPDGRRIALDSWRPTMGEGCADARVFVVNSDGAGLKDLGAGAMPSWSPDGKQLTCSQYGRQEADARLHGIVVMNADGTGKRLIDANGWGSQWSPKRNEISYVATVNNRIELVVYDLEKRGRRSLPLEKTYSQIIWGHTWSADGKWLCFKGNLRDGGCEIAAVSAEKDKKQFKVIVPSTAHPEIDNADATIAWGGPGDRILLATQSKDDRATRLYFFELSGGKPKPFPGIHAEWQSFGPAWSPDGKKIVFSAVAGLSPEEARPAEVGNWEADPFAQ
jgi:TolB protein